MKRDFYCKQPRFMYGKGLDGCIYQDFVNIPKERKLTSGISSD